MSLLLSKRHIVGNHMPRLKCRGTLDLAYLVPGNFEVLCLHEFAAQNTNI